MMAAEWQMIPNKLSSLLFGYNKPESLAQTFLFSFFLYGWKIAGEEDCRPFLSGCHLAHQTERANEKKKKREKLTIYYKKTHGDI